MKTTVTAALTLAFGLGVTLIGIQTSPAAAGHVKKKPMASNAAQIAHGKAVAESNGCNTCHASNYAGKKGFSPSIRATGILQEYTSKTFVRMIKTGTTAKGGQVKKPMPVLPEVTAQDSTALYAFLKSQK